MGIDLIPFGDTDDAVARQAWAVARDAWVGTLPDIPFESLAYFTSEIRRPPPGFALERVLARLDGAPAGYLALRLPLLDNLENAEVEVWVAAEHRRRGVGRALYEHAAARLGALGRKRMAGQTVQGRPGGDEFCAAIGASPALREIRSRLDIAAIDQERLDAMLVEAWTHAGGYRSVRWQGVPPERYIDHVAYLDGRMMRDAPLGDLDWEPENVDADRIREGELRRTERGVGRYHTGVVHEASDRMVGWTTLAGAHDTPTHLWQNNTIVDPLHRGHRLGTIVKLENLLHAREHRPELTAIDTFNASSNEYMLAINRAMGFRAADAWTQWQLTV